MLGQDHILIFSSTKLSPLALPISTHGMKMWWHGILLPKALSAQALRRHCLSLLPNSAHATQTWNYSSSSWGKKGQRGLLGISTRNRSVGEQTGQVPGEHSFTSRFGSGRTGTHGCPEQGFRGSTALGIRTIYAMFTLWLLPHPLILAPLCPCSLILAPLSPHHHGKSSA